MAARNGPVPGTRRHLVLVPGFGGFDALGRVEYYSGITRLFQQWKKAAQEALPAPLVLHYFDNLPTASVKTRAGRLRTYLAKRMARGEILGNDRIVLVGHSTGGLDIRQLVWDLHDPRCATIPVDGGVAIGARNLRSRIDGVVFLSVPHWGTNIADWVCSRSLLRETVIANLRAGLAGNQVFLLDRVETALAGGAACLTGADLLLAVRDALTEANDRRRGLDPAGVADAQDAASELALYLRHMATDFAVIEDLASDSGTAKTSPAHFDPGERELELERWKRLQIRVLSYATVGGRAFHFASPSGCPAPTFELLDPCAWRDVLAGQGPGAGSDVSYRLTYRACAGGPFRWPELAGTAARVLGPAPPEPLELWDNDGIVNTASMLWPATDSTLVLADHLDIVGHYILAEAPAPPKAAGAGCRPPRIYQSYDSLKSVPRLSPENFRHVWEEIFLFAGIPEAFERNRTSQPKALEIAAAAPAC
jgi:triacylglycerol lipase